jgi:tetratricopeptide (TPR) repeat protein
LALRITVALAAASLALAQSENQLDGNKTLFTVMAAMNAAGFDTQADSPTNSPLRKAIRDEVLRRNPPSLDEIRRFRLRMRLDDPAIELRQYQGFALLVKGAPSFELRMLRNELPPDVAAMEDLAPVFTKFYQEAGIEELWKRAQPGFDEMVERYHTPVVEMVQRVNGYLRIPSGAGFLGKSFQIVVDPLGPPNQIQFHSFYDNYYIVVTPSAEPQVADIRRAYMHYLLDPLATAAAAEFRNSRVLGEYVQGAPALAEDFKTDYLLLATRSLIRAIEARLTYSTPAARQAAVQTAMKEGFILTEHFAEQLPLYEKDDQAMRLYFPEMAKAIDLAKEEQRIAKLEFATERAVRVARAPRVQQPEQPQLTGFALRLDQAEELYTKRQLPEARAAYLEVAEKAPEKPVQAKAYYGLARIAALSRDPDLAEKLFQRTLELEPEDAVKAWAHVYLGRLSEAAGDAPGAADAYQAALKVAGITEGARQAAEQGLKKSQEANKVKEQ